MVQRNAVHDQTKLNSPELGLSNDVLFVTMEVWSAGKVGLVSLVAA